MREARAAPSQTEMAPASLSRTDADGDQHQRRQRHQRCSRDHHPVRCACLRRVDLVSTDRSGGANRTGGTLTIAVVALLAVAVVLQLHQIVATPDVVTSGSKVESDSEYISAAGGCRYRADAPVLCVLRRYDGSMELLTAATPRSPDPSDGGSSLFAAGVGLGARDLHVPIFTVIALYNRSYVRALGEAPRGASGASSVMPPIPSFTMATAVATPAAAVAGRGDGEGEGAAAAGGGLLEGESVGRYVSVQNMLPELVGSSAKIFMRRLVQRSNARVSFVGDLSKQADDGGSDQPKIHTAWGFVPGGRTMLLNCSEIIGGVAAAMASAAGLPTGAAHTIMPAVGIDGCTVMHYFAVGDRIESVSLPAGSYFSAAALVIGMSAGLTNCAIGAGQAMRYADARVVSALAEVLIVELWVGGHTPTLVHYETIDSGGAGGVEAENFEHLTHLGRGQ
jgi:hypothetical protein